MSIFSFISNLFGNGIAKPIEAVDHLLDELNYSGEERATQKALFQKIIQDPQKKQLFINALEAIHRSIFVSGWRPAIGWTCAITLFLYFVPRYAVVAFIWSKHAILTNSVPGYPITIKEVLEIITPLLGAYGILRTVEKIKHISR